MVLLGQSATLAHEHNLGVVPGEGGGGDHEIVVHDADIPVGKVRLAALGVHSRNTAEDTVSLVSLIWTLSTGSVSFTMALPSGDTAPIRWMLRWTSFTAAGRCEFLEGDVERSSRFFLSFFLSFFVLIEVEDELEEDDLARFFLEVFSFLDLSFFFFFPSWELDTAGELEALRFLSLPLPQLLDLPQLPL